VRCGQCQFENMPGLDRCFQCGAVLTDAEKVEVNPPRMAGWKKPFRNLLRDLRRDKRGTGGGPKKTKEKTPRRTRQELYEFGKVTLAAVLSIVPGLGHVVRGQFKRVWWAVLLWTGLVAAGIFLYGSVYGYWMIGFAIGLHAWIAVHWPDEKELRGFKRMGAMLAMMVVAAVLYNFVFHRAVDTRWRWGYVAFPVTAKNVHKGDVLLARTRFDPNDIKLGTLVMSDMRVTIGRGTNVIPNIVLQVIGMPGDRVEVKNGRFLVNGKALEAGRYYLPGWLVSGELSLVVPKESFYLIAEYDVYVDGRRTVLTNASVVDIHSIRGIILMRWPPFGRQAFITEY
jgi:hypothetical protein